ncbi:MAG TPA: molybdopterin dinucleotide binding domain-containing protein [Longimicrobiales bacterium]|nr:molybdopterin dinucleotide binding domain-containing protein [Longimicrobiales bacterium]
MSDGIKRRDFLKVLGASGAGAALTGCSPQKVERLIPYVVAPEDITPGVASWYTTVCDGCAAQCGMWVRTREGRAVKVEGNPNHPVSGGALCGKGHATLQHLYNPDRYGGPMIRENGTLRPATWEEAEALLAQRVQGAAGNVLFIAGAMGPSMSALADAFLGAVGGRRVQYDALSDAPLREAMRRAFGTDALPRYELAGARFLVSFGDDFLESGPSPVEYHRGFARMSAVDEHGTKGHFVYAGPRLSLTGLNADEWIPIRPGSEAALALGMAAVLVASGADAGPYASLLSSFDLGAAAQATGVGEDTIRDLAQRFVSEGPSLALGPGVGAHHRSATAAHLATLVLNHVAGNVGRTLHLQGGPVGATRPWADMEAAIAAMAGGQAGVVMVHGANPAYSLPAASRFTEAVAAVGFKVSFASAPDETSALADLVLPDRHFLESWGDSAPHPGVMALRQPVMQAVPHFDAKQTGDVLLSVASRLGHALGGATFYEYLRGAHQAMHGADAVAFEAAWREALRKGVSEHPVEGAGAAAGLLEPAAAVSFEAPALDGDGDFTLVVYPSSRFGAGEFANSPWMLELPDPVSKIAWHSWVELNPAAAEARGIREGDIVTVASPHGSVEVPVWLYPGIRQDVVAVAMGAGHTDFGRWGTGKGANAMALLPAVAEQPSGALVTLATKVTLTPTGRRQRLVTTEGSDSQHDRPIAPAVALAALGHGAGEHGTEGGHGPLKELQGVGGFVPVDAGGGKPEAFPLEGARYGQYAGTEAKARWGMAIDLDKCTGCSACVTACQAENNIPWSGEDQVLMGRELHWMRIERYYEHVDATHASHVDVRFLPMMCQHCGNAPCEPVCPVYATYHTPEGVNAQVYNRCVGTRYCANNCPYKVRVFNWYRYSDENVPEPMNWQFNPDVTVRTNGVMEKCSMCMQRIRDAENRAVLEGRGKVPRDGDIVTACQQSCPAEAIVFGNLRDPDSRISHVVRSERTYRVLDALINTQPGVNYLKKVTFHEVASGGHQ